LPSFSLIVPIHNVADYLVECLDSILSQSFADFEVVAVDDASTDDSPALLDRYAASHGRISAVHLNANVGLGTARNMAMQWAGAPYLLFVDSDDALAPGALQAIADRIAQTGAPDVVMFGFARTYRDGRVVADARSSALAPEAVLRAETRPELLEIIPAAWNKAYRKAYLDEHGFRFAPGFYEDVPWTYPVLMTADPLVTLDRVCYRYRQRGGGNILSSSGLRHLDLFGQYDRAFAYIDAHPELEAWRRLLFDRITRHVPTVLETNDRIPPDVRREFFHAASAAFRRHRPDGYVPQGSAGLKVRLIERDDYRAFRAAQLGNRLMRRARSALPRRAG
jgi:glycosyltransferase involved in cell wall biosynthesis